MEAVQGRPTSSNRFAWQFERNPIGEVNVFVALAGDEMIGVSCHNAFCMRLDAQREVVSFPLNVLTRKGWRGKGVFSALERANEEYAAQLGAPLMLSFPNAASAPIFRDRLGWTELGAPRLVARPRSIVATRRRLPVWINRVQCFDSWADDVWAENSDLDRCLVRDSAYLNWRFVDCPQGGYRVWTVCRGREVVGYIVTATTTKRGTPVAYVASALMVPEWRPVYAAVRRAALMSARAPLQLDLEPLVPTLRCCWGRGTRFVRVPKQLTLIAKSLRDDFDRSWLRLRPWFFQLGDLDFF